MTKFKRLPAEERKKQICDAAKNVFLDKGFAKTSMEDIIAASGMSKGGVYNYYSSISDIMYDLMIAGAEYRFNLAESTMYNTQGLSGENLMIEILLDKILDYNDFKAIYIMFLMEIENEPKFKELYERLKKDSIEMLMDFADKYNLKGKEYFKDERIIALMNTIMLGTEVLGVREIFSENRSMFRNMIKACMETLHEEK